MICYLTEAQSKVCLVFNSEVDCDAALAIQNGQCRSCPSACGMSGTDWAVKKQRATDGKFYFFKNPYLMVGIEGHFVYTESDFEPSWDGTPE